MENPRWITVEVEAEYPLKRTMTLQELKQYPQLQQMVLLNRGRLSVQPVTADEWRFILSLAEH